MKHTRVLTVLLAAVLACAAACLAAYHYNARIPPEVWMGRHLGLRGDALEEFTAAHNRYAATCAAMCVRIRESDERLGKLVLSGTSLTPAIMEAMAASDALRLECRQNMLAHFYEVSGMLDEKQRRDYLETVLPLIVEPELMSREHQHP